MLTQEKRDWLVKTIGEDRVSQMEENHRRMRKSLTDSGVSFKEFVEALAEGEAAGVQSKPPVATATATSTKQAPTLLHAPGFVSADGGKTWTKAAGGGGAPPSGDGDDDEEGDGDDTDKGGEGEGGDASKALLTSVKAAIDGIGPAIAKAVEEAVTPMRVEFDAKLDALKQADDSKIADAWSRKSWKGPGTQSATERDDNIVDEDKAKEITQPQFAANADPAAPYVNDLLTMLGVGRSDAVPAS